MDMHKISFQSRDDYINVQIFYNLYNLLPNSQIRLMSLSLAEEGTFMKMKHWKDEEETL